LTNNVDPFIGTGGHGHTYPGAVLPFGMVQLSPDTYNDGWDWCSGYHESDRSIMGFSHTHLSGTGIADYGDILFMPTTGEIKTEPGSREDPGKGYRSRFSHEKEKAGPGYYSVMLDDYNIKAELTATTRTGYHKYTYPKTEQANVIIDLNHGISDVPVNASIKITGDNEIEGFRQSSGWAGNHKVYFVAKFSRPFKAFGVAVNGQLKQMERSGEGKTLKGYVQFSSKENESVAIKVGISHVSIEGARKNLETEVNKKSFEEVRKAAEQTWEKELSKIIVEGGTKEERTIFYTALYHSLICPNIFNDVDGSYIGMDDKKVHVNKTRDTYTLFSLWDTFRALHPLLSIVEPKRTNDFINTFLSKSEEGGQLPVWEYAGHETNIMIGFHSIPVIFDSYMKGIRKYDTSKLLEAMKRQLEQNRMGLNYYNTLGYIPADKMTKSVSRNLEYAYDEWCLARFAEELGKKEDFEKYGQRALNYILSFDASTGFMRGKNSEGNFTSPFFPDKITRDYEEGTAWHYNLFVPHDIRGLINLFGGKEGFERRLNDLFTLENKNPGSLVDVTGFVGQYAHGNEPGHNMPYLFNFIGQGWRTQEIVRHIMKELYFAKPDGLSGNEDCGQMSAWYVFSAMGFYPVCPGTNEYVIGSPVFNKITIKTGNGRTFVLKAPENSPNNKYIQAVTKNNKPYSLSYIKHSDIVNGEVITFAMGNEPNKKWASEQNAVPYSFSKTSQASVPYMESAETLFLDSTIVSLGCLTSGAEIRYTLDGLIPSGTSVLYSGRFALKETKQIKAAAFKNGYQSSPVFTASVTRAKMNESRMLTNLTGGLNYYYFEGRFNNTADMMKLAVKKTGQCDYPSIASSEREENFGFRYEGYINIPKDGMYKFYTKSDDGSMLFIDDQKVVDNDGPHGATSANGMIALKTGYHKIEVLYYQGQADAEFECSVEGPDVKFQNIPKEWLFRSGR
ncbi:MAG: GH92 family glycosyl hydrolase, partial [Syntrophothermus sp.]